MIKVLRLMEYEYENTEVMENDMGRWYVPPIGVRSIGTNKGVRIIRSTILTDLNFEAEDTVLKGSD